MIGAMDIKRLGVFSDGEDKLELPIRAAVTGTHTFSITKATGIILRRSFLFEEGSIFELPLIQGNKYLFELGINRIEITQPNGSVYRSDGYSRFSVRLNEAVAEPDSDGGNTGGEGDTGGDTAEHTIYHNTRTSGPVLQAELIGNSFDVYVDDIVLRPLEYRREYGFKTFIEQGKRFVQIMFSFHGNMKVVFNQV